MCNEAFFTALISYVVRFPHTPTYWLVRLSTGFVSGIVSWVPVTHYTQSEPEVGAEHRLEVEGGATGAGVSAGLWLVL